MLLDMLEIKKPVICLGIQNWLLGHSRKTMENIYMVQSGDTLQIPSASINFTNIRHFHAIVQFTNIVMTF